MALPRPIVCRVLCLVTLAMGVGNAATAVGKDVPAMKGWSLTSALEELQRRGLPVLFSTALVKPEMVVASEPKASEPRQILDEILRAHGLTVVESGGGQLVVVLSEPADQAATGTIRGQISTAFDVSMLATIRVWAEGTEREAAVASDGRFELEGLPAGSHTIVTSSQYFQPIRAAGIVVAKGQVTPLQLTATPTAHFVGEIVVTPSLLRFQGNQPESRLTLSRDEIEHSPGIGDDLLRALNRLPGAASSDFSAAPSIRGGEPGEVLVLLDGVELVEPFHLKDFQSMFSTIDPAATGTVDVLTGGFPVEYGDRMSGVIDMAVASASAAPLVDINLSTIQARVTSAGTFDQGLGEWLVSARGWYPALLVELATNSSESLQVDYHDFLARARFQLGDRSLASAGALMADDDLGYAARGEEEREQVTAKYQSYQLWATALTDWSGSLSTETSLAGGRMRRMRNGDSVDIEEGTIVVDDRRDMTFWALRSGWRLGVGDRHQVKWGLDLRSQDASYRYSMLSELTGPLGAGDDPPRVEHVHTSLDLRGRGGGLYVAERALIGQSVVAEIGARWDRQSWGGSPQLSPRVNLLWSPGDSTAVRVAWGVFWQSQHLNELQVEDGATRLSPAQRAEHLVVSAETRFGGGFVGRAEVYVKHFTDLGSHWENLFNPFELFPEARADRVLVAPQRGRAHGLELTVRRPVVNGVGWRVAYTWSRADDEIAGGWVPRSWDQQHSIGFGVDLSLGSRWELTLGGSVHSGWPTTDVTGEIVGDDDGEPVVAVVPGPRNAERFPGYLRLDLRVGKTFVTRGAGEATVFLELFNATNRKSLCCVTDFAYTVEGSEVEVKPEYGEWAPIVPSLGVRWRF